MEMQAGSGHSIPKHPSLYWLSSSWCSLFFLPLVFFFFSFPPLGKRKTHTHKNTSRQEIKLFYKDALVRCQLFTILFCTVYFYTGKGKEWVCRMWQRGQLSKVHSFNLFGELCHWLLLFFPHTHEETRTALNPSIALTCCKCQVELLPFSWKW